MCVVNGCAEVSEVERVAWRFFDESTAAATNDASGRFGNSSLGCATSSATSPIHMSARFVREEGYVIVGSECIIRCLRHVEFFNNAALRFLKLYFTLQFTSTAS